jgi:excisionase family DNA binding protein
MTKRRYTSTNVVEPPECQELRQILEKFVTPRDVAEALNVNLNTLDLRIHQGAVLHSKAGHATLIPRADIERLRLNHLDRDDIIGKLPEQRQLEKLLQKFVTTKEAAEWLDLAIVTLTQRVTGGRYPHVRIGQLVLVPRSALPAERVKRVKREYSIDGASNLPECQMLNSLLDQFATTEEMAKLAGFSTASLRNSVSQGRTQCIKVGGRILIPRSLLLTMKRDHHSGHAALPEPPEHELLRETLANFVTIREAAKKARLTISTIWSKLERGSLPSVRVGSSILIPRSELKGLRRTNGRTVPSDLPEHKALRKELKKFYTIEEAAKAMGVDIRTIKAARQDGRLPSFKAGSAILIPKSELKHFKNGSTARRGAAADTQECSAMRKILEQFSTITEAAELLGLERTAVYTRIRSGAIPSIKAGTGILIPN